MTEATKPNIDEAVVSAFGDEWSHFDQSGLGDVEYGRIFDGYFHIFPWSALPPDAEGFDLGCGSGRWAKGVAPRVGILHCVDASSEALKVARRNLSGFPNVKFHQASVDSIPLPDSSMDFAYSLGVLHHVPDTRQGIASVVSRLKPGAPFLLYLYYAFDNRKPWYRAIWKVSEAGRFAISRSPRIMKLGITGAIAALVYWPLARISRLLRRIGLSVDAFPLSAYRDTSFYTMRTDAMDRFGTRLEQRFTRAEIEAMMRSAGLVDIVFSDSVPFWCAVGYRR